MLNPFAKAATADAISGPPSSLDYGWDRTFQFLALAGAWLILLLVGLILYEIGGQALPAIRDYGLSFLTSTSWDANKSQFGILPQIWGTLYSSILALLLGGFFGIAVAIFLTQDF
ncbi:MAG TPA: phosphate ABC transporter permease subunit PstC, partial [Candidatus Competibacteraceae bacterium]|nr:phosphate ABC transporter permease subunit PstC [Candidatus Competibacteraceae bacterium]